MAKGFLDDKKVCDCSLADNAEPFSGTDQLGRCRCRTASDSALVASPISGKPLGQGRRRAGVRNSGHADLAGTARHD
jgi:hypothetical protein